MPLQASTQAIHTQGSLRGRRLALLGSAEGLARQDSVPPLNGGSAHTSKTRTPQVLYVYRSTCY